MNKLFALLTTFSLLPFVAFPQFSLFTDKDTLKYFAATTEPDSMWFLPEYNDLMWPESPTIVGFGYGNEKYTIVDPATKSIYLRIPFLIENKSAIKKINFVADYDDGFIAYLNGVEIARVNADPAVKYPPFDAVATRSHASEYITGLTDPVLGIFLDAALLSTCLTNGENILSVHVINDSEGTDLIFIPTLLDISTYPYNLWDDNARYKRLIDIDSSNIPLLTIETDQYGIPANQSIWVTAHLGLTDNSNGKANYITDTFNVYDGPISIRTRGQSSRDFSKKSYRFELIDAEGKDTSYSLLGMPAESDWILSGPFTDKSQIRNKFAYDLGLNMGNYAPRTRFCELVINGQLEGLYLLTEQIKRGKNRVDISKLKETDIVGNDVTGGYIFKHDKTDANSKWRTKNREIVYPDVLQVEQKAYLTKLFTTYDSILMKTNDFADPVKGFRKYASDSSLADFIIINEIIKNADAYLYSTYMYKNRNDKDGRIKFGPIWDYDIGFGNSTFQSGHLTAGWQFSINNSSMNISRYMQDTAFVHLFQNRYTELRSGALSNDSIFTLMDKLVEKAGDACIRNYKVWPLIDKELFGPGYYVNNYAAEIAYMKQWIETRLEWLDSNVPKMYFPLKIVGNHELKMLSGNLNLKVYPSRFENELTINFDLETESDVRVELYNLTGQLQLLTELGTVSGHNEVTLNNDQISTLQHGMYFAKVIVNNIETQAVKIIKQ